MSKYNLFESYLTFLLKLNKEQLNNQFKREEKKSKP